MSHWPRTRFQPRLYPAFLQYLERSQFTSGETGMVGPRNLVHLWSAKFCSFHTGLVHSGCSRNLTSSGLSSWMCAKCSMLFGCFLWWSQWSWSQNNWMVECSVMSVTKGAYFLLFSLCRWSMLDVNGTVSSKMLILSSIYVININIIIN